MKRSWSTNLTPNEHVMHVRVANILDPIHQTLDARVWDQAGASRPVLKTHHAHWLKKQIYATLDHGGYTDVEDWLMLILTGSLTTYQYSDDSDCDISLFVDSVVFPEWSRAEMIALMVGSLDGTILPGTPHPLQCFVVAEGIKPHDLYKPGLRSGYNLDNHKWVVPPERDRVHDVKAVQNGFYAYALQMADKMERLLRYEPDKAIDFWHAIHKKRMRDMKAGKGDFAESNIIYKMLANRGLFPAISEASGEYIAKTAEHSTLCSNCGKDAVNLHGECENCHAIWNVPPVFPESGSGLPCPYCGKRTTHPTPDAKSLYCTSCDRVMNIPEDYQQSQLPGELEHPDPWMDSEPGSLIIPEGAPWTWGKQGAGTDTQDFFTQAEQGNRPPTQQLQPEDVSQDPEHQRIYGVQQQYYGPFDRHIETSIPGYRTNSLDKTRSLLTMGGGKLLDIAGSTGAFGKGLSALSHGNWQTDNLEPNPQMQQTFAQHPAPNAQIIPAAFGEDVGSAPRYAPQEPYDVVHESMGFQFMHPDRQRQLGEVKSMLKPDGLFLSEQKFHTPDEADKERTKDEWKQKYYTPDALAEKNKEVGFQGQGPMTDNLVHQHDYEKALQEHFEHVVPYWQSGNFAGYAASDDVNKVRQYIHGLKRHGKQSSIPMGWKTMYHVSPTKNREKILDEGLRGYGAGETPWEYTWDQPKGNYLFDNIDDARAYVHNLASRTGEGPFGEMFPWEERMDEPEPPPEYAGWNDKQREDWHDDNMGEWKEKKTDPGGYDIYSVHTHGLPITPDPETRLNEIQNQMRGPDPYWDLGRLHDTYENVADKLGYPDMPEVHSEVGSEHGYEPKRFYVPADVQPHRLALEEHHPRWDLTPEGLEESHEETHGTEIPSPWMMTPMTEWPMPGHESKTAARVLYNKFRADPVHPQTSKERDVRLPWIYAPEEDTVHLGPAGSYHWQLIEKTPEIQGRYERDPDNPEEEQKWWSGVPRDQYGEHVHGEMLWPSKQVVFTNTATPQETKDTITQALGGQATDPNVAWKFQAAMDIATLAQHVWAKAVRGEGITINLDGEEPTLRYSYAPSLDTQKSYAPETLTPEVVEEYIKFYLDRLREPDKYLGAWVEGGQIVLDVSESNDDHDEAFKRSWEGHQQAMWDHEIDEAVPVRGYDYVQPTE